MAGAGFLKKVGNNQTPGNSWNKSILIPFFYRGKYDIILMR